MLKISGVHTFYGHIEALKGIDMEIAEGEIVTLIGANGAGKSTLLMTICGTPQARSGSVVYEGRNITRLPTYEIMRLGIAQSPEGRRIFPRLREREAQRGGTLSGGEQQMLAIARALMSRPRLLLLDEPSLGLAPLIVKQIFEIIHEINQQQGVTVFLVEQNANHALRLAHRGYVLVNGHITLSGTGKELLSNAEVRAAYLEGGH
ncbi:MAG TPA: ABC transporter ATP-binding protein [Dongiaceae bacterium]